MSLEERLREILRTQTHVGYEPDVDRAMNNIIQAFKDEGWDEPSPSLDIEKVITANGYMTGQEWLDRFEGELPKDVVIEYDGHQNVSFHAGNNRGLRVAREAARKAAGL